MSSARNMGIEYALAHFHDGYIAFLDADDFWCENAVTTQFLDLVQQESDTDIFAFGGFRSDADMKLFSVPYTYSEAILPGGNSAIWSLKGQFVANFYSLHILRKWNIRFFTNLKYSEDVIFRLQCAFLSRNIHYLPRLLYCYRENHASAMSKVLHIPPVDYFIPIINGWIRSDAFLNAYEQETGRHCRAGEILSGIYFMDMAEYHYKRGCRRGVLYQTFERHPHFDCFTNMRPEDVSARQFKNKNLLIRHPFLFQCKYLALGVLERIARFCAGTGVGTKLRNKWRYPLTSIPKNN